MDINDFIDVKNDIEAGTLGQSKVVYANLNDVYAFPLYIGTSDNKVRLIVDECLRPSNSFDVDNRMLIANNVKKFSDNNMGEECWVDLPEISDSTRIKTFKARFIYTVMGPSIKAKVNRANLSVGFKFPDNRIDCLDEQYIKWMKVNGYFFLVGETDVMNMDEPRLETLDIYGLHYFDEKTHRRQDIIPYVPF